MFPKIAAVPLYILTESSQTGVPDHRNRAFFPHIPVIPNAGKDPLPRRKSPAKTQLHRAWKQKKRRLRERKRRFSGQHRAIRDCCAFARAFLYRLTDHPTSERRGTIRKFYRLTASASAARRRHSSFRFSTSAFIASSSSAEKPSRSPGFSLFLYIRSVLRTKLMSVATT